MKHCPECGSVTYFDSLLYTNKCVNCNWKDEEEDRDDLQLKKSLNDRKNIRLKLLEDYSLKEREIKEEIKFHFFMN